MLVGVFGQAIVKNNNIRADSDTSYRYLVVTANNSPATQIPGSHGEG